MGAAVGRETDALAFFAALSETPYRYDFYQTLRRLECLYDGKPRWGEALRPVDEPVRLGQDPDLSFAPASLASFEAQDGETPKLQVRLFGLFGPNGPLPIHLTEYARARLNHAGDPTFSRFLDIFHHRFLALFYRAWAQAQPHVNRDRPKADRFTVYVGAFIGMALKASRERDAVPDLAKLFHVGALIRQVRNTEGLTHILRHFFQVPVRDRGVRGPLAAPAFRRADLPVVGGSGARFRRRARQPRMGPPAQVPDSSRTSHPRPIRELSAWERASHTAGRLGQDVPLLRARLGRPFAIEAERGPVVDLGGRQRLGWTTWLGRRRRHTPADDLCLDAEALPVAHGVNAT